MTKNIQSLSWHYNQIWLHFPLISLDFLRVMDENTSGYTLLNCDVHVWTICKLQTPIRMSWWIQECNILQLMFVYSVITCKYTIQTRHYGSHHVTMNTNFSGIPKLRNISGAESLHCYPYLQNAFNSQSFSLDCQMMQLYLLLCFWLTVIHLFESKVFTRNQGSGSHTRQKAACEDKEQECCRCTNMNRVKHSNSELLVWDTMQHGRWTPMLWSKLLPPSSK